MMEEEPHEAKTEPGEVQTWGQVGKVLAVQAW